MGHDDGPRRIMTAECLEEDTILAFAEGRLDPDGMLQLETHTRSCADCQELLALALMAIHGGVRRPSAVESPVVVRGASIGRYVVLGQVGRGGMGEVFAAYDPELDRKIALKLLHTEGQARPERDRGRLLREAKAIARLSHPNVVVVHDAGTFGDRVFVAMEFVEGHTVAAWLAERPRGQREILSVFVAAARGLGAAHAAGIVHRDFKPQNVMVGAANQVRVMDFGLARPIDADAAPEEVVSDGAAASDLGAPSSWTLTLTRSGEMLGTPLYMAPEQFEARRADGQSDQFSFCVALYQALYGSHPFRCDTLAELMTSVASGAVLPAPPKTTVPTWLRRVLLRGLNVQPAERWPSMDALVTALERDPARTRRRRTVVGVVALAIVIAAGVGVWRVERQGASFCNSGPARMGGQWETSDGGRRRERLHQTFLATGLPYAAATWQRTAALLDRYATQWLGMYRDACEATHRRGEQSAEVLDLRMNCLDERLTRMRALVDVLSTADREAVSRSVDAVTTLPALDLCADVKLLRTRVELPADQATRVRVEALRTRAATVDALNVTGQYERGYTLGSALIKEARALGYRPLLAELLERLWAFSDMAARAQEAARDLEEAAWLALASRRDDVAAEAGALLCGVTGYSLARPEEGERWAAFTTAILDRLGPGHDLVRAWLLQNQSVIRSQAHRPDEALAMALEARKLKERVLPPGSPEIALCLNNEAEFLADKGDPAGAVARNLEANEILLHAYGPGNPWLAHNISNRGEYLVSLQRLPEALAAFEEALSLMEAHLGPDHHFLGYPLMGMGVARWKQGHPAEALPPLERALRLREAHEPDAGIVAETRLALARALWDDGRARRRARLLAQAARDFYERPPAQPEKAREVALWLRDHPARPAEP